MRFKAKHKVHQGVSVLKITGEISGRDAPLVSKKIDQLQKSNSTVLVIDLSETSFIDSYGLGVFVFAWKNLEKQGCKLVFMSPHEAVRSIFTGTHLDSVFRVIESIEEL